MKKPLSKPPQQPLSSSSSSSSQTANIIKQLLSQSSHSSHTNDVSIITNTTATTATTTLSENNDAKRLDELRRIFSKLQSTNELYLIPPSIQKSQQSKDDTTNNNNNNIVKEKWNTWLKKQHSIFITQLCHTIQSSRKSSVRTFMGVIASSPIITYNTNTSSNKDGTNCLERINVHLLQKLIMSLIQQENDDGIVPEYMIEILDIEFISKYRDVQYYLMTSIKVIAQQLYDKLEKSRKMKKLDNNKNGDTDDDDDDDVIDEEEIGIEAENLLRILLKIQIAEDQSDLKPENVKSSNTTCSNYLFLPPALMDTEYDDSDDDEGEKDDGENNDEMSDENDDDGDEEEDDRNNNNQSNEKAKKSKAKLSPVQSIRQHRSALQEATLAILKLPIPIRALKLVLQHFPSNILPNTTNPLRFADFCTQAYNMGGVTSLLALNSLFILMTHCGLEYKEFYPSLYNLVEPKVFYAKYRTRFFKLLVKCLSANQMLPAYLVAAFCKKLCRCALSAPPSGALFILALVSNLLRKHEECACIIHRLGNSDDGGKIKDHYDIDEKDPAKSRAIESSLWELNALEQHYHPAVSSMAKGCGTESRNMMMHNLDEFLLHTYKSLFDQERKRAGNKRKSKTPLTFYQPKGLFVENDTFDGIFDFPNKKPKSL